ncbi:ATP-grasp domain-containing protein [Idiomarina piscisalsi]|uniref:ATP-grasp domain-containing protein n=1 Tax=Idiomarina piscisalsi TaxID=1096243 RepID=UPI00137E161E|nr:ATP-grasp domain-containing protein [Idiomarina piscisalsi]MTJ02265.1 ATP-grasp domain-containing protein [Idiomarina piscisalsi]
MKKKILVFPCGSEVALEIHRSMKFSTHFELVGGSSVDDHGKFVFENYIADIPFHHEGCFIPRMKEIIEEHSVDAIFPAMDAVANTLKQYESELGCRVIGSDASTTELCSSKIKTYTKLHGRIPCPSWTTEVMQIENYPVFVKPDVGYGSRGVFFAENEDSLKTFLAKHNETKFLFCEYLPGDEYTIDCFSNFNGELLFNGPRKRARVSNGISVNTIEEKAHRGTFDSLAKVINESFKPRGAWFFQVKESANGELKLLEVAARLGGSSSYFRAKGVNFALLSAFDAFDIPVEVLVNDYGVELDRALSSKYKLDISYDTAYIDFDDCVIINNSVNPDLIRFIFQARNKGILIVLITRHARNIKQSLESFRLANIFDDIIHIVDKQPKSNFINSKSAIFIDDSHAERTDVSKVHGIPVFSPDMIEMLS